MNNRIILLVDDDADDQLIFTDALHELHENIHCSIVNNGLEALVYLQKMPKPILIFLDLNMPGMNGLDFLKSVKSNPQFKEIPVVIYTTSDHPRDRKDTIANGAHLFFTKTADFRMLKTKLAEILKGFDQ